MNYFILNDEEKRTYNALLLEVTSATSSSITSKFWALEKFINLMNIRYNILPWEYEYEEQDTEN